MKEFLGKDFLLDNRISEDLYYGYAQDLPIIDYHCHLSPEDIATDRQFKNITEAWLEGDHYKWRAMRTAGVKEDYITGDANDEEKFNKWAQTVPLTIRNPLYHWTHLELRGYFNINRILDDSSAKEIYEQSSNQLQQDDYSCKGLLKKMKVEVVCTTDDPADSLSHHQQLASENFEIKILPTFRPDKAYNFENPEEYNLYLSKLAQTSNQEINSYQNLLEVLKKRIDYFHENGCRLSDHGLERLYYKSASGTELKELFIKVRSGKKLKSDEIEKLRTGILLELGKSYHEHSWVQQFHLGALRNVNTRLLSSIGPDTGFDSIGDFEQATSMAKFFDHLDQDNQLAKTILYNINPADNAVFSTMIGNFNDGSIKGKMQFGSAWWYLDTKHGIEDQLNTLSNLGILSCFIGMLTDSRSLLSYPRHEYFRRILCNLIGKDVANGHLPDDREWLGSIIRDICYYNAKEYFKF